MSSRFSYQLVQLANGSHSVRSLAEAETFHPVIGPVAEAEALYVQQLDLPRRMARHGGEFVIWDIGLGAAANVLTLLRHTRGIPGSVRVISFDHTLEALRFALAHADALGYFDGFRDAVEQLLLRGTVSFRSGDMEARWSFVPGDFPTRAGEIEASRWDKPHAILFDAYSPAKNPEMWTQPLFARIHALLDPSRPCALPTYSRSTLLRVSLLLAGFFVGAGRATGEKEETTIAANTPSLITEPLNRAWLGRARRSTSAEPLWEPVYRQVRLTPETWEKLQAHPQFLCNPSLKDGS
ncbi:MAG: methyltransferase [Verrucomicrobia bacterium]|nr:methyltransferase [Verrucomicrobiota bacterium]MBI3868032.1 methyltransferase [Verrucomicrobiota bacterium]